MIAIIVSALLGVLVGVLSGMLGIGGGVIMVPAFRMGLGLAALEATATSLFTIIPTSIAGCFTHLRNKTCIPFAGLAAGLGGACTSPLGVYLASISPSWAVMLVAALVIAYSAVAMFRKALATPKEPKAQDGLDAAVSLASDQAKGAASADAASACAVQAIAASAEDAQTDAAQLTDAAAKGSSASAGTPGGRRAVLGAIAIGLLAGLASGYVGVGGGFIMVPLFVSVLGIGMKKASGTSLIAVSILAIPGVVEQMMLGNVVVSTGIAVAIGSIPGAMVGATLAKKVPERQLRLMFGVLLIVAAIMLVLKELGI